MQFIKESCSVIPDGLISLHLSFHLSSFETGLTQSVQERQATKLGQIASGNTKNSSVKRNPHKILERQAFEVPQENKEDNFRLISSVSRAPDG